nr:myoferlin-like [Danaus plexippus plexippus]
MYRNNMIYGIQNELVKSLNEIQKKLKTFDYCYLSDLEDELHKAIDETAGSILKFIDIVQSTIISTPCNTVIQYNTELDLKQMELQMEELEKIHQQITCKSKCYSMYKIQEFRDVPSSSKKVVKALINEAKSVAQHLNSLVYKSSEGWPDIVVWLLNNGSRVAFAKISAADIVHSVISEQKGEYCGRIQTLCLKPLKCPKHMNSPLLSCYCVAGKVELLMWMGLHRQSSDFEFSIPRGYKLRMKKYNMFIKSNIMLVECRAFIYKAKLNYEVHGNIRKPTFVRINALNSVKDTEVYLSALSPVWNQVIKIKQIVFMSQHRLLESPPIVFVEINNNELSGKTELLGRIKIYPQVTDEPSYDNAPSLQWYDFYRGTEFGGQVLMSVQLLQIPERLLRSTEYTSEEEIFEANTADDTEIFEGIETLPINLLPKSSSYKVDVYWWGLRDIDSMRKPCIVMEIEDLSIKSEIITEKAHNCNFSKGRTTQVFEAYLNEAYCLPLRIKLYDASTFGRSLYIGTNTVKNFSKYMIKWLPEDEREASLKCISIMSSDFIQVNKFVYIKKSSKFICEDAYGSKISMRSLSTTKTARRKWYNIFKNKEVDEEKYTLLPVFMDKLENNLAAKTSNTKPKDWWFRYLCSQKDYIDEDSTTLNTFHKLIIYETEVETQPEFSKFKDWCATLKLYNGKKTGIPDKDEKLYCGFLKAGFAIYKWPPPTNTIAVTPSGIDLNKGFFNDHPHNNPAEFLVRVYIVKGLNLKSKEFTGQSNPYVVLNCGNKHIADRNNYVPNSVNPIFGKMHEVHCCLPDDYLLAVSLYDYGINSPDKLIGITTIDLEDRIYSKHRARVGLPLDYSLNEPFKWRDCLKPSDILEEICSKNHLPPPRFINSNTLLVNGVEYRNNEKDATFSSAALQREKLCLSILHKWHTLPICGYHLVPEHVETRTLYDPNKPGIEQGKVILWVDIFPLETGVYIPPPIKITPREAEDYELRLTVYNVRIKMSDLDNLGRQVSDIYVRAWIGSSNLYQNTDVHYQCFEGKGNFNWRMIFHFKYEHADRKLVNKERGIFTESGDNVPPVLVVQVLDNDDLNQTEDLGKLMLNLNSLTCGEKQAQDCSLESLNNNKKIDLFYSESIKSWWPLATVDESSGALIFRGCIYLELTLMPLEKAVVMPVGVGREPPFPLLAPARQDFSGRFLGKIHQLKTTFDNQLCILAVLLSFIFLLIFLAMIYFQLPSVIFDFIDII